MKNIALPIFFLVSIGLSGCATTWHRAGISRPLMEQDLGRCQLQAAKLYPPHMVQIQTAPGYWTPWTQECWRGFNGVVICQRYPPTWNPPTYGERNLNGPARRAWVRACMRSLGFHRG